MVNSLLKFNTMIATGGISRNTSQINRFKRVNVIQEDTFQQ